MTNGEKLNQIFGLPKEVRLDKCMQVFDDTKIKCVGVCSDCRYSLQNWLKKEYKVPKKIWKNVTKNFLTLGEALAYIKTSVCESDIVSLENKGWWVLTVNEAEIVPNEESEVTE